MGLCEGLGSPSTSHPEALPRDRKGSRPWRDGLWSRTGPRDHGVEEGALRSTVTGPSLSFDWFVLRRGAPRTGDGVGFRGSVSVRSPSYVGDSKEYVTRVRRLATGSPRPCVWESDRTSWLRKGDRPNSVGSGPLSSRSELLSSFKPGPATDGGCSQVSSPLRGRRRTSP